MAFYTHFHRRGNAIFLRYVDDRGIRRSHAIKGYKPKLFTKTNKPTGFKSIYGHHLQPIPLENIKAGQEFVERYKGVDGFDIYGNTNWEYACINERFDGDMVYDETKIRTVFIDIETEVGDKFPDPHLAEQRINLITLFDGSIYRMWAFQQIDIDPVYEGKQTDFRIFETEEAMLRDFLRFWKGDYPDVLCGYNSEGFDLPYIVNRIKSQLGEEKAKELSPVNSLYVKMGDSGPIHTLKGIEHLDFLQLIKKFMPGERDFSLDTVGEDMLGEKKLENPFSSFKGFYSGEGLASEVDPELHDLTHQRHSMNRDDAKYAELDNIIRQKAWSLFSSYNRHDVGLLVKLEAKLKLISLAFSVSYMIKMNFSDCFGSVKPWDIFIQNYLARRNEFVPATFDIRPPDRQIAGGFVKDPIAGKYKWVVSFDATSLYPSIIRTFNISPETILDSHEIPSDLLPYYNKEHHESLLANPDSDLTEILKKHNLAMTLNGQFFRRNKQGLIPELTTFVFDERVRAKDEMKVWKKKLLDCPVSERGAIESMITALDNRQKSYKVVANSLYGCLSNQYFRFFDFRCAEGITLTGQYFINRCGTEGSAYIDGLSGQQDSLKYIDTDSTYFGTESLLSKADLLKLPTEKLVDVVNTICEKKIGPKLDSICSDICTDLNSFENHLSMKREKICEAGIWVAKKRYALLAWDDEGLRYTEPKIAVTGLEVKRSSTPKMTRKALSDTLDIMLKGDEKSLKEYVKSFKSEFMKTPLVDIAIPSGVKGLASYSDPKTIYSKDGCPQHVRASLLYNHYLRTHRIEGIYNPILEGSKMKRVYLRLPNPIGENVIGFIDKLPKEFDLEDYIDYDMLFEKTFIQGVKRLADSIGWDYEQKFTLDDFFA